MIIIMADLEYDITIGNYSQGIYWGHARRGLISHTSECLYSPLLLNCCENGPPVLGHMKRSCGMPPRRPARCLPCGHMMSPPRKREGRRREGEGETKEGGREGEKKTEGGGREGGREKKKEGGREREVKKIPSQTISPLPWCSGSKCACNNKVKSNQSQTTWPQEVCKYTRSKTNI